MRLMLSKIKLLFIEAIISSLLLGSNSSVEDNVDYLSQLSPELLCKIMKELPLREVLCLSTLSRKLHSTVNLHLGLCKVIQFTDKRLYG